MNIKRNLVTPRNGEPVIAAIQDFVTASFLLSQRDRFFDRQQFTQICSYFADADLHIDIPPPTILKPQRLWTGKQIFNVLMRPNKQSKVLVNVESKCNKEQKPDPANYPRMMPAPDLSPNDGYLVKVTSDADLVTRGSRGGKTDGVVELTKTANGDIGITNGVNLLTVGMNCLSCKVSGEGSGNAIFPLEESAMWTHSREASCRLDGVNMLMEM